MPGRPNPGIATGEDPLQQFRMPLRQPAGQPVETAPSALGANARSPARPLLDQSAIPESENDLLVGSMLQQPDCGPVAIQAAEGLPAHQDFREGILVDVVVPEIG